MVEKGRKRERYRGAGKGRWRKVRNLELSAQEKLRKNKRREEGISYQDHNNHEKKTHNKKSRTL